MEQSDLRVIHSIIFCGQSVGDTFVVKRKPGDGTRDQLLCSVEKVALWEWDCSH